MSTMIPNRAQIFGVALALCAGTATTVKAGGREEPASTASSNGHRESFSAQSSDSNEEGRHSSGRERRVQQRERRARETEARADERRVRREREARAAGQAPTGGESDATEEPGTPTALPNGGQAGSVSSQAIALPTGEGSIQGMGESFTPSLSAGTGTFSVPITLPPGRAGVQPTVGLAYATSGGNGNVGLGWGLAIPFIARQTDRGLPHYVDRQGWHGQEDRFIYNGGQELVPVDNAAMGIVDASGRGYETTRLPIGVDATWQQYRARIEGGFMRFFRSPDSKRWVVVGMDGTRFDFGLLPVTERPTDFHSERALQSEFAGGTGRIFAWHVTRMSDVHGSNVYYSYRTDGGLPHIESIHYVSPNICAVANDTARTRACSAPLSQYAIRVLFDYASRPDVYASYVSGWRTDETLRLMRITVTAAQDVVGERWLVRRYHLAYDPSSFLSLLASVQLEGRRSVQHPQFDAQVFEHTAEADLTPAIIGATLPPMTFRYSTMPTTGPQVGGFGGVSNLVHEIDGSPSVSLDDPRADLYDVNSDGLPDVVVTDPARYRTRNGDPASGVFWNGFTGPGVEPAGRTAVFSDATPVPMTSGLSDVMSFSSPNIVPMDVDGDGRLDLLHMPRLDKYGYFTPARTNANQVASPAQQGWRWTYASVELPAFNDDPRIDFVRDGTYYRVFDVNNDHLVDVVRTTGTVMQTWMNLGWVPGGDGRFGQAAWNGSEWSLSNEPVETCLLYDGQTLDFGSGEVRLSDMNGDGIEDIVRIRRGRVVYWAGRGDSLWGEGAATCAPNEGAGRQIEMSAPPQEIETNLTAAYLVDVNADGTSDIVQVRYHEVDVWFNRAGRSWTERITVAAPFEPSYAPRSRLIDIDGSGTIDLVYGQAGAWKYMDLAGGMRPRLLVGIENGLGATTTLEYGSSADDYATDLASATSCTTATCGSFFWDGVRNGGCDEKLQRMSGECVYRSGGSPVVSTVVRASETSDNFNLVGREETVIRNEYAYHNGYYEGIEQEFRGFGAADARAIGDASSPTQWTRTWFHQGRRPDSIASDRLAENPSESLKGREYLSETFNEQGQFLSSAHASLTIRTLTTSENARFVVHAFVHQTDNFTYSHAPYVGANLTKTLSALRFENVGSGAIPTMATSETSHRVDIRAGTYALVRSTTDTMDNLGHVVRSTAHGRRHQEADGATLSDVSFGEEIVTHANPMHVENSPDGWLFRSRKGYITDIGLGTHFGETDTEFDTRGQPISATQYANIVGFSPFLFAGGSSGSTQGDQQITSSTAYDPWGSVAATCGGGAVSRPDDCLRYRRISYEEDPYGQQPNRDLIAVSTETGAHCASAAGTSLCMLETKGDWDRGLGALTRVTELNGQVARVAYDGLGRITFIQPASMDKCDQPPTVVHYEIGVDNLPVHVIESISINRTGVACAEDTHSRITARAYVDGLTRNRATLTYVYANSQWEQRNIQVANRRGLPFRAYEGVYMTSSGAPAPRDALRVPSTIRPTETTCDAFGRSVMTIERDGSATSMSYGALETKSFDALDRSTISTFSGTPSIVRADGHNRTIQTVETLRQPNSAESEHIHLRTTYRVDGSVVAITRFGSTSSSASATATRDRIITRQFYFDTAGRKIGISDPDTNSRIDNDPRSSTWRYLHNAIGDLIAIRDPRGCGQDFFYDNAGRVVGESYVSCAESQATTDVSQETIPAGSIGLHKMSSARSVDVRTHFDALPPWSANLSGVPSAGFWKGRVSATADRGQRSITAYDSRGRVVWTGRQMAMLTEEAHNVPNVLADPPTVFRTEGSYGTMRMYDESVTYTSSTAYDHLGRVRTRTFPTNPDWAELGGSGAPPAMRGTIEYDHRGLPYSTRLSIGSHNYQVHASMSYGPNRLPTATTYGSADDPVSSWIAHYDVRQRMTLSRLENHMAASPSSAISLGEERVPFDLRYSWDEASNLVAFQDNAPVVERLLGHMPPRQIISHDSLYRVAGVSTSYRNASDTNWTTDVATDWRDARTQVNADGTTHKLSDPMRREPAPMISAMATNRVMDTTYRYDWLGNMTSWNDSGAQAFHERELGSILNGTGSDGRPSALYMASDLPTTGALYSATADRGGYLRVEYGDGGNVESLTVHGQCRDASVSTVCVDENQEDHASRDAYLRGHCTCAVEQHYQYRWDEVNRLVEARRYDRPGAGAWFLAARQRYAYDAANQRKIKQTLDPRPPADAPAERIALYVLQGDYERVGVRRNAALRRYTFDAALGTESQYSIAGARVVWKPGEHTGSVSDVDREHRVIIGYSNLISSITSSQDLVSGLLVEQSTFMPNGARETLRTTEASSVAPEALGFTGKEEDEEVGLIYFGERYLVQHIGRWLSPDPLSIHEMGGGDAGNAYHYVSGNLLQTSDPLGLSTPEEQAIAAQSRGSSSIPGVRPNGTDGWNRASGRGVIGLWKDGDLLFSQVRARLANPEVRARLAEVVQAQRSAGTFTQDYHVYAGLMILAREFNSSAVGSLSTTRRDSFYGNGFDNLGGAMDAGLRVADVQITRRPAMLTDEHVGTISPASARHMDYMPIAIAWAAHAEHNFERGVRMVFGAAADRMLAGLSLEARIAWIQVGFGRPGLSPEAHYNGRRMPNQPSLKHFLGIHSTNQRRFEYDIDRRCARHTGRTKCTRRYASC